MARSAAMQELRGSEQDKGVGDQKNELGLQRGVSEVCSLLGLEMDPNHIPRIPQREAVCSP